MKDYGKQRSAIKPRGLELTETKVFVYSDATPVSKNKEICQGLTGGSLI